MTLVLCTDTRGGMLFAGRRQSRDRAMLADLATLVGSGRLLCRPFSEKLLTGAGLLPTVCEDCPEVALSGDTVFLESPPVTPYLPRVSRLVIYSWGEAYPYDTALDIDPKSSGLTLKEVTELAGYSHKTIKREVFVK